MNRLPSALSRELPALNRLQREAECLPVRITSFRSAVDCDEDVPGLLATISDDNGDNSLSDEIDVDGDA